MYDKANIILDIGAGSGILALAAARISHRPVYAIDIDPTAVDHSKFNTNLNQLEHLVTNSEKIPPLTEPGAVLICLNMISSEQKIALAKNLSIIQQSSYIISSGILESDKESYLTWMSSLGWQAAETTCQDGWAAFFLTPITR